MFRAIMKFTGSRTFGTCAVFDTAVKAGAANHKVIDLYKRMVPMTPLSQLNSHSQIIRQNGRTRCLLKKVVARIISDMCKSTRPANCCFRSVAMLQYL